MRLLRWGGTLVLVLAGAAALAAQGKGKPSQPSTIEAVAGFRCFGQEGPAIPECQPPLDNDGNSRDRARGDQELYDYFLTQRSGGTTITAGAFINGRFTLRTYPGLPNSDRSVRLILGTSTNGFPCAAIFNCYPTERPAGIVDLHDVRLLAKPVVEGTYEDLPGGLLGLGCDDVAPALVTLTFPDENGDGHWGLNFNPRSEAKNSTMAEIVRTGLRAWTIRATAAHTAGLLGFAHSGIKGKNGPSQEGTYVVPFELSVTTKDPQVTVPPMNGCN